MKTLFFFTAVLLMYSADGQTSTIRTAYEKFEKDPQLKHALSSLCVMDAKSGSIIFQKNSSIGLAPASTQKVITSVAAYAMLGPAFRYETHFILRTGSSGNELAVIGSGDPTFGSPRFPGSTPSVITSQVKAALKSRSVKKIYIQDQLFGAIGVPDGFIWQDIGNYYGAGHYQLNWKENQYDISFTSGTPGGPTAISNITLDTAGYKMINQIRAGKSGSGDNAYAYAAPFSSTIYFEGTVPPSQNDFKISGADPDPAKSFASVLSDELNVSGSGNDRFIVDRRNNNILRKEGPTADTILTYFSPSLDSIIYWFNRKSINLYGQALLKSIAFEKYKIGSADSSIAILQRFYKPLGIDPAELNLYDGSGLSPLNRLTTHAHVEVLRFAKEQPWFKGFYNALPEYNGMKMKSGTISDVKGFCGYHTARDGKQYIFSFLVNNYSGSAAELVKKMYAVLDELK
jgi:D-alanyl-D-alanine carboxypeptidase/D-alanyl-D-alanine-endopeptidase (penicillin-binding protein 4)